MNTARAIKTLRELRRMISTGNNDPELRKAAEILAKEVREHDERKALAHAKEILKKS